MCGELRSQGSVAGIESYDTPKVSHAFGPRTKAMRCCPLAASFAFPGHVPALLLGHLHARHAGPPRHRLRSDAQARPPGRAGERPCPEYEGGEGAGENRG
jgi:hypothetical protein